MSVAASTQNRARKRLTREEKNAVTRARLLDAAREVFAQRGYHGASLEEIADEAGFSRGALYHHFESKEALFLALLDERLAEREGELEEVFGSDEATTEAVYQQTQEAAGHFFDDLRRSREWRALFLEFVAQAERDPRFRAELAVRDAACRAFLTRVVERRARDLGLELPLAAEQLAVAIEALGNGLAIQEIIDSDTVSDDLFGTVLNFLLAGIAAAAAPAGQR